MNQSRQASISLRKIWQAHDEKNEAMGTEAAINLYQILGVDLERAKKAGPLVIQAFFYADEAEKYQSSNPILEDEWYEKARELLVKSREICGLEIESPQYTVKWWKGYRHKDVGAVLDGLVEEHRSQFTHLDTEARDSYAELCAKKEMNAARKGHDIKNWEMVDSLLSEYFDVYFEALTKR